jgi:glycosyltransferase involved in cell wall biosynthesis
MKASVSIVTYQQVDYIRQSVDSVLRQKARFPFEVIVGDDASTDGTREVLEDLRAGAPDRVKLLFAESNYGDFGLSNFMATVDAASGEYIALLDGDDYWTSPDKLQAQVDFMDAHPECAICAHRVEHVTEDGSRHLSVRPGKGNYIGDIDRLLSVNFTPKSATMVRRSSMQHLPAWYRTTTVASSAWLFNLLMTLDGKVGFIDEVMAAHRVHSQSVTFHYGLERMLSDNLRIYKSIRPYIPRHEAALRRAERQTRWKLRIVSHSPHGYRLLQSLYNSLTLRRK